MEKRNLEKVILASLTGIAGGVILGLLFAPDKGRATRKKLSRKGDDYLKEIKKEIEDLRKNLNNRADVTKEEMDELSKRAKKKGKDVLKEAKKITSYDEWTKEELYQKAKEIEIDGYSQMNKSELIEALRKN